VWIAKNPEVRANMGRAGRLRVQQRYDWQVKAQMLLKIYGDVVRDACPPAAEAV
jgi:glycosyltransferase involved in cell wall biosynthesis